jgi:outer membrane lipoprotein-sorting protein
MRIIRRNLLLTAFLLTLSAAAVLVEPACSPGQQPDAKSHATHKKADKPPAPAEKPAPPAAKPAPAEAVTDVSPEAMAILNRLEQAGDRYTTLTAEVTYTVEQRLTGDIETRTGTVAFQQKTAEQPAKFRIDFETLQLGRRGPVRKQKLLYLFDGMWLTIAKYNIKQLTRVQVAAKGEAVQALRIGKGPFPVPFGQKADDIASLCEVATRPTKPSEPKETDYLLIVPRKKNVDQLNFTKLEMWIDQKTDLPVKIVSRDKSKNVTTVAFENVETSKAIDPKLFVMDKPVGWDVTVERLGD